MHIVFRHGLYHGHNRVRDWGAAPFAGQSQGSRREAGRQVPRHPVRLQPDLVEVIELCIAPVDERRRVAEAADATLCMVGTIWCSRYL